MEKRMSRRCASGIWWSVCHRCSDFSVVVFVIGAPTFSKISFCEHFLVGVFPSFESERDDQHSNGRIKCFTCFRCLCSLDKMLVMVS